MSTVSKVRSDLKAGKSGKSVGSQVKFLAGKGKMRMRIIRGREALIDSQEWEKNNKKTKKAGRKSLKEENYEADDDFVEDLYKMREDDFDDFCFDYERKYGKVDSMSKRSKCRRIRCPDPEECDGPLEDEEYIPEHPAWNVE